MAIQNLYPNTDPTLLLDFASVKALDPRITFTRASTARYYDGVTTSKAEENLLVRSQEFETTWSRVFSNVTANSTTAPDGTTTADTLTESSSGTNQANISQAVAVTINNAYTLSVFVKQGTETFFQMLFGQAGFGVNAFANFNVTTGAGAVGTVGSSASASIVDVGNGWYRCIMTATSTASSSSMPCQMNIVESTSATRAPEITLNSGTIFLWGAQLEQRSAVTAYTPTTTQPITNYVPVLQTALANTARFDHNPVTGESLGLLIEESRTNFVPASLTHTSTVNSPVYAIIPFIDGTNSNVYSSNLVNGLHRAVVSSILGPVATTLTTQSVYVKIPSTSDVARLLFRVRSSTGSGTGFVYNVTNGVVSLNVSVNPFGVDPPTAPTASNAFVQAVGNNWYRIGFTSASSSSAAANTVQLDIGFTDQLAENTTGTGATAIAITGWQLEVGTFPTSYIPTVASQVTRSNDSAIVLGTNFSSWYRPDEGSAFCIFSRFSNNTAPYPVAFTGGSSFSASPRISLRTDNNVNLAMQGVSTSGSVAWNFSFSGGGFQNIVINAGISFSSNSISAVAGGNAVVEVTPNIGVPSGIDKLFIGAGGVLNGHYRKIAFYPKAFQTQLQGPTV